MNIFSKSGIGSAKDGRQTVSEFDQERMIEAILFASTQPLSLKEITSRMPKISNPKAVINSLQKSSFQTMSY